MAREKKPVHKVQMTEGKRSIIHQLLDALKALLGGTITVSRPDTAFSEGCHPSERPSWILSLSEAAG